MDSALAIVDYQPFHRPWFEQFNRAWIEKYFEVEDIDREVFSQPEENIIKPGGTILIALWDNHPVGTVALRKKGLALYELTKMAVDENFRGRNIGQALGEEGIRRAQQRGGDTVILYSNTLLKPAMGLYRKLGFREVELDGPYKRSDVKMALDLSVVEEGNGTIIRRCSLNDVGLLSSLGEQTFRETFTAFNTKEDMGHYLGEAFTGEAIGKELRDTESAFYIVSDGMGQPMAYAKFRKGKYGDAPPGQNPLELQRLYVLQENMGKGIGHRLMEKGMALAKHEGCDVFWLGVWEHNHRAKHFYGKWGFERYGEHDFKLGNDIQTDYLLCKRL